MKNVVSCFHKFFQTVSQNLCENRILARNKGGEGKTDNEKKKP